MKGEELSNNSQQDGGGGGIILAFVLGFSFLYWMIGFEAMLGLLIAIAVILFLLSFIFGGRV